MPLAPAPASTCQHLHCQTARLLALQPTALHRSLSLTHTRTHTVCFGTLNLGFASTKRSLTALHSTREMISCSDVQNYPHGTLRVFVWGGSTLSLPKALQCSQWRASATGNVNQGPRELVTAPTSTVQLLYSNIFSLASVHWGRGFGGVPDGAPDGACGEVNRSRSIWEYT
ncbi:hypothetical protein FPOAC1_000942 [Fusarium poae]|uniref:hypothetical protein n=1 Tax=Fusarium poae TaxID=36050 RepID=UPI001CE783B2|nr:hypothetical protein FPOAC1_000942 [Fusarium poae]KAG8674967.1 hypothetical protein FPOAC1_000942 [Fusarium poae]